MRFRALVITTLFLAGVATSVAVAKGPPPGKGKNKKESVAASTGSTGSAANCRPNVAVVLKGDFVSGSGSEDEGVFQMKVRQANSHGKRYVAETVTVAYDEKTRFTRRGPAELDDFEAGDRLNVQARTCKAKKPNRGSTTGSTSTATTTSGAGTSATGSSGGSAALLAKRVTGAPARTGTTTTGTTTAP